MAGSCEYSNEPSGCIKGREFFSWRTLHEIVGCRLESNVKNLNSVFYLNIS
jgi:hypothetical protein